jgi:hypothetical protein
LLREPETRNSKPETKKILWHIFGQNFFNRTFCNTFLANKKSVTKKALQKIRLFGFSNLIDRLMDTYPFKEIMSALGLSVKDIADFLGYKRSYTQLMIAGHRRVGDDDVFNISKLYALAAHPPASKNKLDQRRRAELDALRQSLSARNVVLLKQWRAVKKQIEASKAIYLEASDILARYNQYYSGPKDFDAVQELWLMKLEEYWSAKLRENDTSALFALLAKENAIKQELAFNRKAIQTAIQF